MVEVQHHWQSKWFIEDICRRIYRIDRHNLPVLTPFDWLERAWISPGMILGANQKDRRDNLDQWIQNNKKNKYIINIARDLKAERQ